MIRVLNSLNFQEKRDLVTGLKARTKAGRPDWDKVFTDIKNEVPIWKIFFKLTFYLFIKNSKF